MNKPLFQKNNRLLVIDDNQDIHADFRKILQNSDELSAGLETAGAKLFGETPLQMRSAIFEIDSAFSGEEGLVLVQKSLAKGRPYALAFVDMRMAPGWDGIETTARICQNDPDIQIVICTAYSDYSWDKIIEKLGQSDRLVILKKPFDSIEVLQMAHALTEKWELGQRARARTEQLEEMVATRTRELQVANEQLKTEMAERARTEESLRQAQKMEALGQLAGGIAHDFNNLLTIIRGYVECLVLEAYGHSNMLESLHQIDVAAERAARLTSQMLMFSRKKRILPQSLNLNEVIAHFGTMLRRLLGENIVVDVQCGSAPLIIHADPVMIEMVVLNLSVNARDAMPQGGRLEIRVGEIEIKGEDIRHNSKARPGWFACISIADTGSGIAPETLPHLFEPFFTTKEVGKGTGLGLATVYGIVKQHEGWIEVASDPGHGAKFDIFLPNGVKNVGPVAAPDSKAKVTGGNETILVVEDEEAVRRLTKAILQRHGYRIFDAGSGVEALTVWKEHQPEIDLLLTDMIMPGGISGRELAERLLLEKPALQVIYTTGYSLDAMSQTLALTDGLNFLPKPYHPNKLLQTTRRCLDEIAQGNLDWPAMAGRRAFSVRPLLPACTMRRVDDEVNPRL
jgi:signal transduction histidine kinase